MFGGIFSKRKRVYIPDDNPLVNYSLGVVPEPSASQAAVFEPLQTTPVFLVRGPGTFAGAFRATPDHPQVYVSPATTVAGIGGRMAGIIELQPLIDPYESVGG